MHDLLIEGSACLPTVSLLTTGQIKISGRALPEDAVSFFKPVVEWLMKFTSENIKIEINLDYFNTSVSKILLDIFKIIENNEENKSIEVRWLYEEGDEEMLESGEIYQELLPRIKFSFHKYAELARDFQ